MDIPGGEIISRGVKKAKESHVTFSDSAPLTDSRRDQVVRGGRSARGGRGARGGRVARGGHIIGGSRNDNIPTPLNSGQLDIDAICDVIECDGIVIGCCVECSRNVCDMHGVNHARHESQYFKATTQYVRMDSPNEVFNNSNDNINDNEGHLDSIDHEGMLANDNTMNSTGVVNDINVDNTMQINETVQMPTIADLTSQLINHTSMLSCQCGNSNAKHIHLIQLFRSTAETTSKQAFENSLTKQFVEFNSYDINFCIELCRCMQLNESMDYISGLRRPIGRDVRRRIVDEMMIKYF